MHGASVIYGTLRELLLVVFSPANHKYFVVQVSAFVSGRCYLCEKKNEPATN
jgi:hypothetical protein